eukprot:2951343-Pyramimonas_sp.AAC.1
MGEEVHKSHVTSAIKPGASRLEAGLRTQQAVLIQDIRGGGTYTLCHRGLLVAKGILVDGARRRLLLRMGPRGRNSGCAVLMKRLGMAG